MSSTQLLMMTAKNRIPKNLRCGLAACSDTRNMESYSNSNFFTYKSSSKELLVETMGVEVVSEAAITGLRPLCSTSKPTIFSEKSGRCTYTVCGLAGFRQLALTSAFLKYQEFSSNISLFTRKPNVNDLLNLFPFQCTWAKASRFLRTRTIKQLFQCLAVFFHYFKHVFVPMSGIC